MKETNEEEVLFKVSRVEDNVIAVEVHLLGFQDRTAIVSSIVQTFHKNKELKMIYDLIETLGAEDFIAGESVEIPDFNELLKGNTDSNTK